MKRRPFPTLASAFALLLLSTSCFTTTLWGAQQGDDLLHSLGREGADKQDFGPWAKILLTPFALALDLCTAPVQAAFNKLEDEDDDC